ncbi:MAG: hypothetical protein LQ342_006770 [Letrouitia transgressa]|nr:MAG: hypothetical protein LQ342_006770 [Letrouitia transgressa]
MYHYVSAYFLIFNFVYSEFLNSLLWEILLLFFNNFYGIRQVLWARIYVRDRVIFEKGRGHENEWGFGQLLALLLLVLPVLSALEAYYDTRSKGRQDYHELTSVSQTACNIQGVISPDGAVNSQTHLVSSAREADTAHLEDSQPSLDSLGIPWGIRIDNLFDSAIFWIFLAGLITYTLATMIVIAYYLAWHIGPETYPGIKAGIAMGAIGVFAALSPLYHDYQRLRHPV